MLSLGGVASPDRRLEGRGPRHLRRPAGALQPRAGGARDRRRRRRHRRRPAAPPVVDGMPERADAGRLRLGHHRHVRRAVARAGRRGGGGRRPHHRRRLRASGRQGARLGSRPASASGATARRPGATSRSPSPAPAGAAPGSTTRWRSSAPSRPKKGARPGLTPADGLHHRRAVRLLRARRRRWCPRGATCPPALRPDGRADRRELRALALPRCSSWPAPAARCAPASPQNPVRLTRVGAGRRDPADLRRRAGLRLAGRRHHLHGRCHPPAATAPSATCRRRRWSRRSSSPCRAPTTSRSAATRRRSARSTTSLRRGRRIRHHRAGGAGRGPAMTGAAGRLAAGRPPAASATTGRST